MIEFLGWVFLIILTFAAGWLLMALVKRMIRATKVTNKVVDSITIPEEVGTVGVWREWFRVWRGEVFSSYYTTITVNGTVINWDGSVAPPQPVIIE